MPDVNDINYAQYTVYDHTGSIDQQATNDAINKAIAKRQGQFGTTSSGLVYDSQNADSYVDAMNQQAAWARDDTYYRRLFNDLKGAGINPAVLFASSGGATGVNSASSFKSSSIESANRAKTKEKLDIITNSAKIAGTIISILAAIAALA